MPTTDPVSDSVSDPILNADEFHDLLYRWHDEYDTTDLRVLTDDHAALLALVERLTQERDAATRELGERMDRASVHYGEVIRRLEVEVVALRTQVEALRGYVRHAYECPQSPTQQTMWNAAQIASAVCTCGLAALLAPEPEPPTDGTCGFPVTGSESNGPCNRVAGHGGNHAYYKAAPEPESEGT